MKKKNRQPIITTKEENNNENNNSTDEYDYSGLSGIEKLDKLVSNHDLNIDLTEFCGTVRNIKKVNEMQFNYMVDLYKSYKSQNNENCNIIFNSLEEIDRQKMKILQEIGLNSSFLSKTILDYNNNLLIQYHDLLDQMIEVCFIVEQIQDLQPDEMKNDEINKNIIKMKRWYNMIPNKINKVLELKEGIKKVESYLFSGQNEIETVILPKSLLYIYSNSFSECINLTTINLKCVDLEIIGDSAFSGCHNLIEFIIPNKIKEIKEGTFKNCKKLKNVSFSDELVKIGAGSFEGCESLTEIIVPISVKQIDNDAFKNCISLKIFVVPGVFYIYTPDKKPNVDYEPRPDFEFTISENCFAGCKELFNMDIMKIKSFTIGKNGFGSCSKLENIVFNLSTTTIIGESAFEKSDQLKNVKINVSENVSLQINNFAFRNCGDLTDFSFDQPDLLAETKIVFNSSVFMNDKELKEFVFPQNSNINECDSLFEGCKNLSSISLPIQITKICKNMFKGCSKLESIDINKESITIIDDSAFEDCENLLIHEIPSKIQTIGKKSFKNCAKLNINNFPEATKTIMESAFENCHSIIEIVIPGSIEKVEKFAFRNCHKLREAKPAKKEVVHTEAFKDHITDFFFY